MRDFSILDGEKRIPSSDLPKMYGSEEKALIYLYQWDKDNIIKMDEYGNYKRNV